MSERQPILIIGGGMAGIATAYALRHRGADVRLVEARTLAGPQSSSYGQSRMFREMYSDPYLCGLARESNRLWRAAERELSLSFRRTHGLLFYGQSWDEETIEGSIPGAKRVMDEQGIPYEALDADAIRGRWPIEPQPEETGLFEPTAGAVLSDIVLQAWARAAREAGVVVEERRPVAQIEPRGTTGAEVVFEDGERVVAEHVVLTAGVWSLPFLTQLQAPAPLQAWGMLWAHYEVEASMADAYPQWFCFRQAQGDDGGLYYGFPVMGEREGRPVIKAGIDWAPPALRASSVGAVPSVPPAYLVDLLDSFLHENLRGVVKRVETRLSPYTMSPDVQFILDTVSPGVSVFTAGSGQAFKFAPLIGALLSDLVEDRTPRVNIEPWSLRRSALASTRAAE